jgi:starch synthase
MGHPPALAPSPWIRPTTAVKVAFATPELQSLVRRTNLAEVAEQLPRALVRAGADVRVFVPYTRDIDPSILGTLETVGVVNIPDGQDSVRIKLLRGHLGDMQIILVDHAQLFRSRNPYGDSQGPYADNWRRYAIFARAVLEGLDAIGFNADVIHCLDWTTGLIPVFQELEFAGRKHGAGKAGTYFAIHNQAMQGSFERDILPHIGLPHKWFQAIQGVELGGKVNYLKGGAEFATIIGSHSPRLVEEVGGRPFDNSVLDTLRRRKKDLVGVPHGVDYRSWDPASDPLLAQTYGPGDKDHSAGKRKCKASLQQALKLDNGPRTPLICVIGKFDTDGGFEVLTEALTPLLERSVQLVMMGPGSPEILERLHTIEQTFAGRCRIIEGYNVNTAHVLLGGSDMLLMPAHFHSAPTLCSIALRYGVVPIAYEHSGLEDCLVDLEQNPKASNGIFFPRWDADTMLEGGVDRARAAYKDQPGWKQLVQRCLEVDMSWDATAQEQLKAYRRVKRRLGKK